MTYNEMILFFASYHCIICAQFFMILIDTKINPTIIYGYLAPKIFYVMFAMIKPFLSQKTKDKMHVLGGMEI